MFSSPPSLLQNDSLVQAYPPFINYFETMREKLAKCDLDKPRFHAFLKVCQTRPECGRQSLQELLIRPVQRLPSISLLLNGKHFLSVSTPFLSGAHRIFFIG